MDLEIKEIYLYRKMVMAKFAGKRIKYLYYKFKHERIQKKIWS